MQRLKLVSVYSGETSCCPLSPSVSLSTNFSIYVSLSLFFCVPTREVRHTILTHQSHRGHFLFISSNFTEYK